MAWEEHLEEVRGLLAEKTPEQVATYVENNINDFAAAKQLLKKLLIFVLCTSDYFKMAG